MLRFLGRTTVDAALIQGAGDPGSAGPRRAPAEGARRLNPNPRRLAEEVEQGERADSGGGLEARLQLCLEEREARGGFDVVEVLEV